VIPITFAYSGTQVSSYARKTAIFSGSSPSIRGTDGLKSGDFHDMNLHRNPALLSNAFDIVNIIVDNIQSRDVKCAGRQEASSSAIVDPRESVA